jgi:YHS domain-containing protein
MNKLVTLSLLVLILVAFMACSGEKKVETGTRQMQQSQTSATDTTKATCPGCGMEMAKSEMVKYEADGKTLYFCSEYCKENYLATAEKKTDTPPASKE